MLVHSITVPALTRITKLRMAQPHAALAHDSALTPKLEQQRAYGTLHECMHTLLIYSYK
jgi:hypothetical protein